MSQKDVKVQSTTTAYTARYPCRTTHRVQFGAQSLKSMIYPVNGINESDNSVRIRGMWSLTHLEICTSELDSKVEVCPPGQRWIQRKQNFYNPFCSAFHLKEVAVRGTAKPPPSCVIM